MYKKTWQFLKAVLPHEKTCVDLVEGYRQRWSIETSHRMIHEMRARTCSKNFGFRWFLVLFAMLVRNAYYLLNEIITEFGHITLKTFAELIKEEKLKDILLNELKDTPADESSGIEKDG